MAQSVGLCVCIW